MFTDKGQEFFSREVGHLLGKGEDEEGVDVGLDAGQACLVGSEEGRGIGGVQYFSRVVFEGDAHCMAESFESVEEGSMSEVDPIKKTDRERYCWSRLDELGRVVNHTALRK